MKVIGRIRKAFDDLLLQPRHLLALRLTLLLLIFYGAHSNSLLEMSLRILCGIMLIWFPLTTSWVMWLLISVVIVLFNMLSWFTIDNHQYLITYWCLTCTLAVAAKDPDELLSFNGRILIGLCFLFAVAWKFISGEYVDGSFLHLRFLLDHRLETPAMLIGGLGPDVMAENHNLIKILKSVPSEGISIALTTSPALRSITLVMSYWTLLIEGSVAVAFLFPRPQWLHHIRDILLMIFISTTYFLLPVSGFAFVLSLLGFAQCPVYRQRTRIAYLLLFLLIQLAELPMIIPYLIKTLSGYYVPQWVH